MAAASCCRLFLHHYEEYMDRKGFEEALEVVNTLTHDYEKADNTVAPPTQRAVARGLSFL